MTFVISLVFTGRTSYGTSARTMLRRIVTSTFVITVGKNSYQDMAVNFTSIRYIRKNIDLLALYVEKDSCKFLITKATLAPITALNRTSVVSVGHLMHIRALFKDMNATVARKSTRKRRIKRNDDFMPLVKLEGLGRILVWG